MSCFLGRAAAFHADARIVRASILVLLGIAACLAQASGYCEYSNAAYTGGSAPGDYYGATIRWASDSVPNSYWLLTKKDGTVYEFTDSAGTTNPSLAAAIGMHDRYGNALTFTRDANGNLLKGVKGTDAFS